MSRPEILETVLVCVAEVNQGLIIALLISKQCAKQTHRNDSSARKVACKELPNTCQEMSLVLRARRFNHTVLVDSIEGDSIRSFAKLRLQKAC